MSDALTSSRVDYFTVTALRQNGDKLWSEARTVVEEIDKLMDPKLWRFFGYEGMIYSDAGLGHFAWGESPVSEAMGVIVQSSGDIAQKYFDRFLLPESRFSRVDLAVDVYLGRPQIGMCGLNYDWLMENGTQDRTYSYIRNNQGGETLYINSRQSDQFGRMYDKGVETTELEPGHRYRYEVEFKRNLAKGAVGMLQRLIEEGKDVNGAISAIVYDWFDGRGVAPLYRRNQWQRLTVKADLESKSDERRILWLRTSVSPTVKRLILSGNREVLKALGIEDFYIVRKRVQNLDIYQP